MHKISALTKKDADVRSILLVSSLPKSSSSSSSSRAVVWTGDSAGTITVWKTRVCFFLLLSFLLSPAHADDDDGDDKTEIRSPEGNEIDHDQDQLSDRMHDRARWSRLGWKLWIHFCRRSQGFSFFPLFLFGRVDLQCVLTMLWSKTMKVVMSFQAHRGMVNDLLFKDSMLWTCGHDTHVNVWDVSLHPVC